MATFAGPGRTFRSKSPSRSFNVSPVGSDFHSPTAVTSRVTGIASLVLSWCCGLGLVGIVAVVLGVKARGEIRRSGGTQSGDGLALAGIITGAVAIVLGLVVLVAVAIALSNAGMGETGPPGPGTGTAL